MSHSPSPPARPTGPRSQYWRGRASTRPVSVMSVSYRGREGGRCSGTRSEPTCPATGGAPPGPAAGRQVREKAQPPRAVPASGDLPAQDRPAHRRLTPHASSPRTTTTRPPSRTLRTRVDGDERVRVGVQGAGPQQVDLPVQVPRHQRDLRPAYRECAASVRPVADLRTLECAVPTLASDGPDHLRTGALPPCPRPLRA